MFGRSSGKIDLPSMPATLARIIHTTNAPEATAEQLARIVMLDQSLATKVLRLANSAYIGRKMKAENVTEAVVTLGFGSIRNLAASASVVDALFPKRMFIGFNWPDMWTHSVTCAVGAEAIFARMMGRCGDGAESAFVAGLLHDVGKLIIARALPQRFLQVIAACRDYNFEMLRAENNILSTTHAKIGKDLAQQWDFPEKLVAGIAYHHSPEDACEHEDLARAVHAANLLAKRIGRNYIVGVPVDISTKDVADAAGLTVGDINLIVDGVRSKLRQCGDLLAWGDRMPGAEMAA
ncbi:MAG: HDOD domain-containing protein [Chloroflexi bacterium]|nr:HDOD domain-containing protein [Chloroflexota bacterium]